MKRETSTLCAQSKTFYYGFLTNHSGDIPRELAVHISNCEYCQNEIQKLDEAIRLPDSYCSIQTDSIALHMKYLSCWIGCDIARSFLAVQSYPEMSVESATPITIHFQNCSLCMADMRKIAKASLDSRQLMDLNSLLNNEPVRLCSDSVRNLADGILKRNSSDVLTRMTVSNQAAVQIEIEKKPKTGFFRKKITSGLAKAALAASIMLVASLFLFNTTSVSGTSIRDIYTAITKLRNCHIESIVSEQNPKVQDIWISKQLQVFLCQTPSAAALWDISQKKVISSDGHTDILNDTNVQFFLSKVNDGHFGLLPFSRIEDLPAGCQWGRNNTLSKGADLDVFELTWLEGAGKHPIGKIWRVYIHPNTRLPERIEWIDCIEKKWITTNIMNITYPDTKEILGVIKLIAPDYYFRIDHE